MTSSWDYTEFVERWRRAGSCAEVAKYFGISTQVASSTACRLRRRGVKMKLMPPGRRSRDWEKLRRRR